MKIHLVLGAAGSAILLAPTGALAIEPMVSVGNLQRFQAHVGERMSGADCRRHYRSFEVRNRMPGSQRRRAELACIAAHEKNEAARIARKTRSGASPAVSGPSLAVMPVSAPRSLESVR